MSRLFAAACCQLFVILAATPNVWAAAKTRNAAESEGRSQCLKIVSAPLSGGHVTRSQWVEADSDLSDIPTYFRASIKTGTFCRALVTLTPSSDSDIRVEVWLPVSRVWNGKLKGVGSGGLGGTMPYDALGKGLMRGYATVGTDTGHSNAESPGKFALQHPDKISDYGFRAIHLAAITGKRLTQEYYNHPVKHAYFEGCSQGGQEALMEAQRFPRDYDGIISGDPDYNQTHHEVGAHLWVVSTLYTDTESSISMAQAKLIGDAVNEACDALDGVEDGVLEDPRRCHFDPRVLQCQDDTSSACLTPAQVAAVRKLWEGPAQAISPDYYPGLERGGEATLWKGWIVANSVAENVHGMLGLPFFRYFVFDNPNWDYRTFDYHKEPAQVEKRQASTLDAVSTDLRKFAARGGKLIQYHGFSDPDVPPRVSIEYYEGVVHALHSDLRQVQDFYRLFMVPGMGHCAGGPGANVFDMTVALERWVEEGAAPSRVIANKFQDDNPDKPPLRTHPLCPYPQSARYTGRGSSDDQKNYMCMTGSESSGASHER